MKYLLMSVLLLVSFVSFGQSWKKRYVTSAGDTIVPNKTVVQINGTAITYIYPNYYDGSKGSVSGAQLEKKKRYLLTNMIGNQYTIERLSRVKVGDDYKAIAAISGYKTMTGGAEYIIEIEEALKNGEIEVVK